MAKGRKGAGTAAPRRGAQQGPDGMRAVGEDVWRRSSAACLEQMSSDSLEIEAFLYRQRESNGRIRNREMTESEEAVRPARPRRGAVGTPKGMPVVSRSTGKRRKEERNG